MRTAEEILVEKRVLQSTDLSKTWNLQITRDTGIATSKWIIEAMHEFAAQEVEAYKDRLKDLISQQVASNQSSHLLTESQIHGLIDITK